MPFWDGLGDHGHATALLEAGEPVSYADLAAMADRVGAGFLGSGLVFLLVDNVRESVVGYLAALRVRVPAALLSASLAPELLAGLLERYRPLHVWLPTERLSEIPGARPVLDLGRYSLVSTGAPSLTPHPELALLLTTSGSTGSPKFVRQSHRNVSSNAEAIAECLAIGSEDRPITTLPMHYVFGLSVINSHLHCGATLVLTNRALTEKPFWELLRSAEATSLAGIPFTYDLLRRLRFSRMDLPSLRVLTQAGGKLDAGLVREFAEICGTKGVRFYVMYGASEATARMACLPPEQALERPASIGVAIPGGRLSIEDEQGAVVEAPDTVGELVYSGDNVTMGYATRREDLALGDERGGVLRTGDMARRDAAGFYYVVGRKSRFLKVFGNRVSLDELEQLVRSRGFDCACAGEDNRLRIYVTDRARADEVMSFVQKLTGLPLSACRVVPVDRIPRNEAGKILYAELS